MAFLALVSGYSLRYVGYDAASNFAESFGGGGGGGVLLRELLEAAGGSRSMKSLTYEPAVECPGFVVLNGNPLTWLGDEPYNSDLLENKSSPGLGIRGELSGTRVLVLLSYRTLFDDPGLPINGSLVLTFRPESVSVEVLLTSASKLRPSLSRPDLPIDCHAMDAALLVTGSSLLDFGGLGTFFPDLNVCNMVLPFSGLGLRDDFFIGGTNDGPEGAEDIRVDDGYDEDAGVDELRTPTTALVELLCDNIDGR